MCDKKSSIHGGHRSRLKQRFLQHGLDSFDGHQVLELLLFYAIPRRDVNPIAHDLMRQFGNLSAVFHASVEELCKVSGITENAATLIRMIPSISRRYLIDKEADIKIIDSVETAGQYIMPYFSYEQDEVTYLLCMDNMRRVICCTEMSRGNVNSVEISGRRVMEEVLVRRASAVILAHNHPGGMAFPSREDEVTTQHIAKMLNSVGVELTDHLVFADDDFVSMYDSGLLAR